MPKPLASYGFDEGNGVDGETYDRYVSDAIRAADRQFDFSQVAGVYVVPPPGAQTPYASGGGTPRGTGPRADGHEVPYSAILRTSSDDDRLYTGLLHETGHMLGLPDLYDWSQAGRLRRRVGRDGVDRRAGRSDDCVDPHARRLARQARLPLPRA